MASFFFRGIPKLDLFEYSVCKTLCLGFSLSAWFLSQNCFGWGERGHDVVTRVASRLLSHKEGAEEFSQLMKRNENKLAHYANVPDIVWRNDSKDVQDANKPTHFLDLEYLIMPSYPMDLAKLPITQAQAQGVVAARCSQSTSKKQEDHKECPKGLTMSEKMALVGSAPWRIDRLLKEMEAQLRIAKGFERELAEVAKRPISNLELNKGESNHRDLKNLEQKYSDAVDQALLMAGLASHFVGDVANPNHCTRNYNGFETGNGGIHSFFETSLVDEIPLGLAAEVYAHATAANSQTLESRYHEIVTKKPDPGDYLAQSWVLILDSFRLNGNLFELDHAKAIIKPSDGNSVAQRRFSAEVVPEFRPLIVERLSTGAQMLGELWYQAWLRADRPHFKEYRSYRYIVAPDYFP